MCLGWEWKASESCISRILTNRECNFGARYETDDGQAQGKHVTQKTVLTWQDSVVRPGWIVKMTALLLSVTRHWFWRLFAEKKINKKC